MAGNEAGHTGHDTAAIGAGNDESIVVRHEPNLVLNGMQEARIVANSAYPEHVSLGGSAADIAFVEDCDVPV